MSITASQLTHALNGGNYGVGASITDNTTVVHKFGSNAAVGTTYETVWSEGGVKTYQTSAVAMTLSSSDADDNASGAGARTVKVTGIDANWNVVEETISCHASNGQTGVTLANTYMIVYRMQVLTAGASLANEGILYVGTGSLTAGKPQTTVECLVAAGENQSEVAYFPVPSGKTAYLLRSSISVAEGKTVTAGIYVKPETGVFNLKAKRNVFEGPVEIDPCCPLKITEKSIIEMRAKVDATTADVTGDFELLLI